MTSGGFGKKLKAAEVIQYGNDWIERVRKRRDEADRIVIEAMTARPDLIDQKPHIDLTGPELSRPNDLILYVERIPVILKAAYMAATPLMGGSTSDMLDAAQEVIDVLIKILVRLAAWYPQNHFDDERPRTVFQ